VCVLGAAEPMVTSYDVARGTMSRCGHVTDAEGPAFDFLYVDHASHVLQVRAEEEEE
jgi:hypothetical protein